MNDIKSEMNNLINEFNTKIENWKINGKKNKDLDTVTITRVKILKLMLNFKKEIIEIFDITSEYYSEIMKELYKMIFHSKLFDRLDSRIVFPCFSIIIKNYGIECKFEYQGEDCSIIMWKEERKYVFSHYSTDFRLDNDYIFEEISSEMINVIEEIKNELS